MTRSLRTIVVGAALAIAAGSAAWAAADADRAPTPQERTQIAKKLRAAGFVQWRKIELESDDNLWEVDDASTVDGRTFDLKLKPDTFEIVSRKSEN